MTTPISSDKILPSDSNRTTASEKRAAEKPESIQPVTNHSAAADQDKSAVETGSVDVGRANQIYSQEQTQISSREDPISSPEQARAIAAEIGKLIEENGPQALNAQAGSLSMNITALLETAPA